LFVGVGVLEAGGSGGVAIGNRCNLLPRQLGDDLRPRIRQWLWSPRNVARHGSA
jgi:hypothetical protein